MERELRTALGLATPEDPEPQESSQLLPQGPPEVLGNAVQTVETADPVHDPIPSVPNASNPPAQSSEDMQVDQTNALPVIAAPQDQTPVEVVPPALDPVPSTSKSSERPPPVSEPPQPPWDPIGLVDDEEEEEEIPSINMDSDSD